MNTLYVLVEECWVHLFCVGPFDLARAPDPATGPPRPTLFFVLGKISLLRTLECREGVLLRVHIRKKKRQRSRSPQPPHAYHAARCTLVTRAGFHTYGFTRQKRPLITKSEHDSNTTRTVC